MSLSDPDLLELDRLCHAVIDGAATPEEGARLQARLADSAEARRYYVRATALSASLFEYAGEMQSEEPELIPFPAPKERSGRGTWWAASWLAAAALLMIGFWLSGTMRTTPPAGELARAENDDDVVAQLSGAKDCRWNGAAPAASGELHRGQQLNLVSGYAEIAFDCGAVVCVEGPAMVDLTSEWEAALKKGTLQAKVPPEAIGFRVSNPEVDVVDLGTEFSMVAEGGGTEVFVTKGAVETRREDGAEPLVLHEREARRFARAGVSEVRDRDQKMRRLTRAVAWERKDEALGYLHWSFDEEGPAAAELVAMPHREVAVQFTGAATRVAGRFEQALAFDGQLKGRASLDALAPDGPRAAAFWVRIPADAQISEASTLVAWTAMNESPKVEISWNRRPSEGPVGALRVEMGHGYAVGTTPLRDGQWHHLAVVLMARHETRLQVREYVDGRLESIAGRHGGLNRGGRPEPSDPVLTLGEFRGTLDELFLSNRPLAPREIKNLIEHNRPSLETTFASR
jgi:ferric-dicitrate binding protein FerR (iron transport regulator)